MDETTAYLPGLSPVKNKELCARFDGGRLSSDGGVLVLRGIEKRLGLAARLAGCLGDARDPASTTHSYADMIVAVVRTRMFGKNCPVRAANAYFGFPTEADVRCPRASGRERSRWPKHLRIWSLRPLHARRCDRSVGAR